MMLAAVGCRLLLLAERQKTPKGFALTSRSRVKSGSTQLSRFNGFCDVRRNDGWNVINVGAETVVEGNFIGERSLEISIRSLGS